MSWHRIGAASVAAAALLLSGCLRPLYGPTASGVPLRDSLAAIEVEMVGTLPGQERLGHYVRSELIYDLDGSGRPSAKRYRLTLDASEAVQVTTTDTLTGRADAALLNVTVKYALRSLDGARTIGTGTARATATYFRDPQRFASVRAARDAEIRAAKLVSDDIKQRLAAHFATAP